MQLSYANEGVKAACLDRSPAKLDSDAANEIHRWVADLRAAQNLSELAFLGIDLTAATTARIVIRLERYEIVCRADHIPSQKREVDWGRINRVQIVSIDERKGMR